MDIHFESINIVSEDISGKNKIVSSRQKPEFFECTLFKNEIVYIQLLIQENYPHK